MLRALDVQTGGGPPGPGIFTTVSISENLAFNGTAQRIFGDFDSTPEANRLLFETIHTNQTTAVGAIPNGTGNGASFKAYATSNPDNSDYWEIVASTGNVDFFTDSNGPGSPNLRFWVVGILAQTLTTTTCTMNLNFNPLANITFAGTGQKIIGAWDGSAASPVFQNTGFNDTIVPIMPGPGGGQSSRLWVFGDASTTNYSYGELACTRSSSVFINSGKQGSGTQLAIDFKIDGNAFARLSTAGKFLIGTITPTAGNEQLQVAGSLSISDAVLIRTYTAFTNGAAAATGTLTNAPVAGNPTKWIPINDNGTTRYIPAW